MAAIQNERTQRLQATVPRIIPVPIPIDQVEGLPEALAAARALRIAATDTAFIRNGAGTSPTYITLDAIRPTGVSGAVVWSVIAGSATITPTGTDNVTCVVTGASVAGYSVTIQAAVSGYTARITLNKFGALTAYDTVNLTTQVTGQLASGNVDGLGALALLNVVNLNTQTTGALNGVTQVTNLGTLAYANAIAANQIGAGTLAAGVIYAGNINAAQINAGTVNSLFINGGGISGGSITGQTSVSIRDSVGVERVAMYANTVGGGTLQISKGWLSVDNVFTVSSLPSSPPFITIDQDLNVNGQPWKNYVYRTEGPTTGAQTANFSSTNKPGTTTTTNQWVRLMIGGELFYLPVWK